MNERMQKMSTESDSCPQQSRPEAKGTVGVQTFMRVVDGCLTTEQPTRYPLLEQILQSSGWDDPEDELNLSDQGGSSSIWDR